MDNERGKEIETVRVRDREGDRAVTIKAMYVPP